MVASWQSNFCLLFKLKIFSDLLKLDAHGVRTVRFLSACVWFRNVTSFSDASGMVYVRV